MRYAGEERFRLSLNKYIKGEGCILFGYNITVRESFENLNSWLTEIKKISKNLCMILVETNCDLEDERKVTFDKGKDLK